MRAFPAALPLVVLVACTDRPPAAETVTAAPPPPVGTISGTVDYRERVALTDRAVLELSLEDISRQDVAAQVIAERAIPDPGQVPIRFELEYPANAIDPRRAYALRARITDRGLLLFTTDTVVPVLTRGAGNRVNPTLVQVNRRTGDAPETSAASAGVPLKGKFRYMADAARFRDCRTNKSFPVAMEGAYIEVERAYFNSGIDADEELPVSITGRFLERPKMEGEGSKIKLIVDTFDKVLPENACVPPFAAELINTYWKLIEVGGAPVGVPDDGREPHLLLDASEHGIRGHAGCNRFFGRFETGNDSALSFSGVGSTMMACPDGMDIEQAFLQALGETTRYEISGETLSLLADDRLLARFEAVYL